MAASGRPVRSLDPRTGGMSRPGEDPRRGCQGSEEGTWDEECVGKGTEGKEFVQTMRRGSHTPYPVGRRIASLIPPAHIARRCRLAEWFLAVRSCRVGGCFYLIAFGTSATVPGWGL